MSAETVKRDYVIYRNRIREAVPVLFMPLNKIPKLSVRDFYHLLYRPVQLFCTKASAGAG